MKRITLHPAALVGALLLTSVAAAAVEDRVAFNRGYARGSFDGQHETVRNTASALSTMMRDGVTVREADGSSRHFVLTPVETPSH